MKLYRTRTQAEYDWLAKELGKKGMTSYIPRHEQGGDIVVYADEKEGYLSYSDLDYAEKEYPNEPIIEVSDLMDTVDHDTLMQKVMERNNKLELVNHPDHYQGNKFEVIDIIEDYELNFTLGSAVKYILRAGKKDDKNTDLKKAIWMLERELEEEE